MDKEKYVDESWKEQASEEKDLLEGMATQQAESSKGPQAKTEGRTASQSETTKNNIGQEQEVEVNFLNYVTSLGFQAMIFMGEIPNPVTNAVESNLTQAKFLIDTLAMLKEKTAGNLNAQENDLLESSIYELQMKYVQIVQKGMLSDGEKGQDG